MQKMFAHFASRCAYGMGHPLAFILSTTACIIEARNGMIGIERLTEAEIERIRQALEREATGEEHPDEAAASVEESLSKTADAPKLEPLP